MALDTVIQQGRFTSTGGTTILDLRAGTDWIRVYNETVIGTVVTNGSTEFYWTRGQPDASAFRWFKVDSDGTLRMDQILVGGFTPINTSTNPLTAAVAVTSSSDATQPIVLTGSTAGLSAGDVVLVTSMVGQENVSGQEYTIDTVVTDTSFRLANAFANVPGAVGAGGTWRQVRWDPIFYPRRRFINNITSASPAVITTSADHGLTVGQEVRMVVPAVYAMTEMDGLKGTITAVTASTITLDIDASAFTAFVFPAAGLVPFTQAQVVPFGQDTPQSLTSAVDILGGAADNQAVLAMSLPGGSDLPGGTNNDVMYWMAGKSFDVTNL